VSKSPSTSLAAAVATDVVFSLTETLGSVSNVGAELTGVMASLSDDSVRPVRFPAHNTAATAKETLKREFSFAERVDMALLQSTAFAGLRVRHGDGSFPGVVIDPAFVDRR